MAARLVGVAAEVQHEAADGVGRVDAVVEHFVVSLVARLGLVDLEGGDEVAERLREMGYAPVWKDWEGVLHGRA